MWIERWFLSLPRRLRSLFSPQRVDAELQAELQYHIERRTEDGIARGLRPSEARRQALLAFGGIDRITEACRDERSPNLWVSEFARDCRHGLRQLVRRPSFLLVSLIMLGLGIGGSTALFAVSDYLLLRPLPFPNSDRIITLWEIDRATGMRRLEASPGNFLSWQERARSVASIGALEPYAFDVEGVGSPESVSAWRVGPGWFDALGVQPLRGRLFDLHEYDVGVPNVVLISEDYWNRRFGRAENIIGQWIQLAGVAAEIVGVLPGNQLYPEPRAIWTPKTFLPEEANDRRSFYFPVIARLAAGVTLNQAQAEFDAIATQLATEYPDVNAGRGVRVLKLRDHLVGDAASALLGLSVAIGLLLLIACTNISNLLLARSLQRRREWAVRKALGASRGRLVRQLTTECVSLATLGALAGGIVAMVMLRIVSVFVPDATVAYDGIGLQERVRFLSLGGVGLERSAVLVLVAATVVSAVLFTVLPVLTLARGIGIAGLRTDAAGAPSAKRLRSILASSGVAVALTLLIGAGLLARSFISLTSHDLGFDASSRVFVQTFLWERNRTPAERVERARQMMERISTTPGVLEVAATSSLPFHPSAITSRANMEIVGGAEARATASRRVHATIVTPGYFGLMSIPVREGREFGNPDRAGMPPVAIVNETLADLLFADGGAVGQRVRVGVIGPAEEREIVGVVRAVRAAGFDVAPQPEVFVPHAQQGTGSLTFVARTDVPAASLLASLQQAVWDVDPQQTIYSSGVVQRLVDATLSERRLYLLVVGLVASLAFLLAAVGIYGLVAYLTEMRTREIGVRLAMGADERDIIRAIVGNAVRLAIPGMLGGLAGGAAFGVVLRHMLYGTSPLEASVYGALTLLIFLVTAAAGWVPARRSLRVGPLSALRHE